MAAPQIESAVVPLLARHAALFTKLGPVGAQQFLERSNAPDRAMRIIKAPVPATSRGDVSADIAAATVAWIEYSRTRSLLFRLISDRAIRLAPFRTRLNLATSSATAAVAGEGRPIPTGRITLANGVLEPRKAAAIVVSTAEAWADMSSAGQAFINTELRGAIADETDQEFFSSIIDSSTPEVASIGTTAVGAKADLHALLSEINVKNARIYLIAAPDVALAASTLCTTGGADAFPAMAPDVGGEMANLPCLVSSAVPAGTLYALDAQSIAANIAAITISTSREADLEMLDSPTQDQPAGASMVSLFQNDLIAVRATVDFGAERLKTNALAMLTGITWGEVSPS